MVKRQRRLGCIEVGQRGGRPELLSANLFEVDIIHAQQAVMVPRHCVEWPDSPSMRPDPGMPQRGLCGARQVAGGFHASGGGMGLRIIQQPSE
jgi:hypothetical protein